MAQAVAAASSSSSSNASVPSSSPQLALLFQAQHHYLMHNAQGPEVLSDDEADVDLDEYFEKTKTQREAETKGEGSTDADKGVVGRYSRKKSHKKGQTKGKGKDKGKGKKYKLGGRKQSHPRHSTHKKKHKHKKTAPKQGWGLLKNVIGSRTSSASDTRKKSGTGKQHVRSLIMSMNSKEHRGTSTSTSIGKDAGKGEEGGSKRTTTHIITTLCPLYQQKVYKQTVLSTLLKSKTKRMPKTDSKGSVRDILRISRRCSIISHTKNRRVKRRYKAVQSHKAHELKYLETLV
jgi:hypothetical protein